MSTATHDALLFAAAVVFIGACLSWLIPNVRVRHRVQSDPADQPLEDMAEELGAFVPIDPDAELLEGGTDRAAAGDRPG